MTTLTFTINGNQKDSVGNAIPYKRTLSGKFRKGDIDYMEWKEYVRSELDRAAVWHAKTGEVFKYKALYSRESMPYPEFQEMETGRAQVHIKIFWRDGKHGDGDNVLKGVMDALFKDDKGVWAGSFESKRAENKLGHVEVTLILE